MRNDTYKRTVSFQVGDQVRCIDATEHYPDGNLVEGGVYTVVGHAHRDYDLLLKGVSASWDVRRFEKVTAPNDLERLMNILSRAGAQPRSWHVSEYVMKDGVHVQAESIVLVHGSDDDGPYTEYLFDRAGNILPGGTASYYARGTDVLEKA